jgi:DNA-nicking Smr family endonuclease
MNFRVGEKVGFLYEKGGGTIRKIIDSKTVFVEDETGFERPFLFTEIIKIHSENYQLSNDKIEINEDESLSDAKVIVKQELLTGRRRKSDVWEIDLHIEELLDSHRGMSNTEILLKQMTEFRSFFKRAQNKGIQKLVVIHGVGEGVLKNEIRMFLSKKDNVEFYDASYAEYGKGATEIRLFHLHSEH